MGPAAPSLDGLKPHSKEWIDATTKRRELAKEALDGMSDADRSKWYGCVERRKKALSGADLGVYLNTKGQKARRRSLLELFVSSDGQINEAVKVFVEEDVESVTSNTKDKGRGWFTKKQLLTRYSEETVASIIEEKLKDATQWMASEDAPKDESARLYKCFDFQR